MVIFVKHINIRWIIWYKRFFFFLFYYNFIFYFFYSLAVYIYLSCKKSRNCTQQSCFFIIREIVFPLCSNILSHMNPLCNLIHYLIADQRISRAKHIRANTKCHCRRHSEKSCCDRECSESVKCSLPCISCGISDSDSTNHSDIRIHGFRKCQIQDNKEQASYNVEQPFCFPALDAQSFVNGRHTGHAGDSCPHDSRSPRRFINNIALDTISVSFRYHLLLAERMSNSRNRSMKVLLYGLFFWFL